MINLSVLDYRIKSSDHQLALYKVRRDKEGIVYKDGEELTTIIGYYNTLEQVLKGIKRHHTFTSETEIKTLKDYCDELKYVEDEFNKKLDLGE
jgi:hypothetical protein